MRNASTRSSPVRRIATSEQTPAVALGGAASERVSGGRPSPCDPVLDALG
jgi:hypothetical protein